MDNCPFIPTTKLRIIKLTLTMTKAGYQEDFVFKGKCKHCGAEFEADKNEFKGVRTDQNCDFCQAIRTVRFHPASKQEILHG